MANIGRIIAGIGTLGASELVAKPLSDAADASESALSNIKGRKVTDLNLGTGAGTDRIAGAGSKISGIPQAQVTDAGSFASANDAAGYIQGLQSKLGISGPQSALDATRTAAERKLDTETYQQSLQDAQQLASQGQSTGARSQALGVLRGQALAGNKANLEANLQQGEADATQNYNNMLLNLAQRQGGAMSSYDLNRASQANQAAQSNAALQAQREQAQAGLEFDVGGALNAEEYKRAMAGYQNRLDQLQQENTADVLALNAASDKAANITGLIGAGIGAAGGIASAGLKGPAALPKLATKTTAAK
ncbi:hypothetical protein [uncultured Paraglaciecola sp.]|uniref:hypothetical protein n=1 Tax=uncultured Paraglaciecola sp. TaxID=1765024 RepID=UPI00260BE295|nr:hypothetical protein [uncultured Paraglaciecola sp.]